MLTILGSIIGFLTSALPDILDLFKKKTENNQNIKLLQMQMEAAKMQNDAVLQQLQQIKDMKEMQVLHQGLETPTGVTWVDGLRASVRPIITYSFFILFSTVKIVSLFLTMKSGSNFEISLLTIWDDQTQILFSVVIAFWFGQRALSKIKKR